MARKKKEKTGLRFSEYTEDSSCMSCSGCTKRVLKGSLYIGGNLSGSGSKPFLILCPECQDELYEYFMDRNVQKSVDHFASLLTTKNKNAVDVARQQRGVL